MSKRSRGLFLGLLIGALALGGLGWVSNGFTNMDPKAWGDKFKPVVPDEDEDPLPDEEPTGLNLNYVIIHEFNVQDLLDDEELEFEAKNTTGIDYFSLEYVFLEKFTFSLNSVLEIESVDELSTFPGNGGNVSALQIKFAVDSNYYFATFGNKVYYPISAGSNMMFDFALPTNNDFSFQILKSI